jgi:hypothetical protein
MVQILQRNRPTFGEQIGAGFQGGIESGVKTGLQNFLQKQQEERQFAQQLGLQKHRAELERQLQADKLRGEYEADEGSYKKIKDAFGEKFADIWLASPTGARTELTKAALEANARGIDLEKILGVADQMREFNNPEFQFEGIEEDPERQLQDEISKIKSEQDTELLPGEKIARGKERYATGLKEYQEAGAKLQSMSRDKERLDILENLNKSEKLHKSIGRINVDKEGNLKFPFLASPEAQRYVKTLNEFSAGAKDTFGSRVTNFDLAQYMKRYPTLLNTTEGRKQLLEQMKIVNQINSVYYKNLKNVYDKAGGARNIDTDVAERLALEQSEKKVNQLSEKFKQIGQFASKPAASEFTGKRIRDKETGEVFVSDGENWIPE